MSKLIKNELIKIFKKKTIYIALIVILLFLVFMNIMFKYSYGNYYNDYAYSEGYIEYLDDELAKLDPSKPSDTSTYIDLKSQRDMIDYMSKYDENAWQRQVIGTTMMSYIQERNTFMYGTEKNEEKVAQINEEISAIVEKLDKDDWKYFVNTELEQTEQKIKELEAQKNTTEDKQILQQLDKEIAMNNINKEVLEYRINKEIKYGNDYLNNALSQYSSASQELLNYDMDNGEKEVSYKDKQTYNQLIENKETYKYLLDNEVDVNKTNSLKGILEDFYNQFGLFIIVVIVMIAGTIVSEEFNKGTVKLLLVKPYSRTKILLSKFITTMIIVLFTIIVALLMQVLVGGIIFGFDSLSVPVVHYNFNTNSLQTMNIFAYVGLQTLAQLPMIILLATLAFALSTIFTNSALAITIALLGYMANMIINQLAIAYNLGFMRYFVTLNWDFSQYLFAGLPLMEGMTLISSIIICVIYFLIMIIPTFIIFKKKNIKNI